MQGTADCPGQCPGDARGHLRKLLSHLRGIALTGDARHLRGGFFVLGGELGRRLCGLQIPLGVPVDAFAVVARITGIGGQPQHPE